MNTNLATNGLPEISLVGMAKTDSVGGSASKVKKAADELILCANSLKNFIVTLEDKRSEILVDWEGEAAEAFNTDFPKLLEAFSNVEPIIRSFAEWSSSTMDRYTALDKCTAEKIRTIAGGV